MHNIDSCLKHNNLYAHHITAYVTIYSPKSVIRASLVSLPLLQTDHILLPVCHIGLQIAKYETSFIQLDIVGELRTPRVIVVLVCEVQSSPENLHEANIHTAEVAIAQLTTKRLQGVVAITMGKNRSAHTGIHHMIQLERIFPCSLEISVCAY